MKTLLTITALAEAGTGLGALIVPSLLAQTLLGAPLEGPVAQTIARVGGAALLTIGVACWLSRNDGPALVVSMLLYNILAVAILTFAALGLTVSGIGLWPAVCLHTALALWCVVAVKSKRSPASH
jgi:hypothetical protein